MRMRYLVVGMKAKNWNEMVSATVLHSETGEVENFTDVDAFRDRVEGLAIPAFAHYGGDKDYLFLMPLQSVIMAGSRIQSAQLGASVLHDTSDLFAMPLGKVAKMMGMSRHLGSDPIGNTPLEAAQLQTDTDCGIVHAALDSYIQFMASVEHPKPRLKTTAGSAAIYLLEALEPDGVAHLKQNLLDIDTWASMSQAIMGSRCEMFRRGVVHGVYTYDINSSYAKSWTEKPMPVGPWRRIRGERPGKLGVYFCDWIRQERTRLPLVQADDMWRYDGKGFLTSEEIAAVREGGGDARVAWGWVSERAEWFGRSFVETIYPYKQAQRPWAKGLLVSLHGKTVQGLNGQIYYHTPRGYVMDETLTAPRWFQNPLMGHFIFKRASLRLGLTMQRLQAKGFGVYYGDADSIHTDCPPDRFPEVLGGGVGEWRCDGEDLEAVYVAPKVYGLRGEKGIKIAASGINSAHITWDMLVSASQGAEVVVKEVNGVVGFRAMMMSMGLQPKLNTVDRAIISHLGGKREIEPGILDYVA